MPGTTQEYTINPNDIVTLKLTDALPAIYVGNVRTQKYRTGWVSFRQVPLMEGHTKIKETYPFISALNATTSVTPPTVNAVGKQSKIIPMQPSSKPGPFMYGQFKMLSDIMTPWVFLNNGHQSNWAANECLDAFMYSILNDPNFIRMLTEFSNELKGKSEEEMPMVLQTKIKSYFANQK